MTDPVAVSRGRERVLIELDDADAVRAVVPDHRALRSTGERGVIVTAAGDHPYDITSRYFAPGAGIDEDPVTGAAHCTLGPYWGAASAAPSCSPTRPRGGAVSSASRWTTPRWPQEASGCAWPGGPCTPSSAPEVTGASWYNFAVIVSHRWKFIFVKTRKTAGTSIEHFLLPHLGPDDAIRSVDERHTTGRFNPLPELRSHPDRSNARLTLEQWARQVRFYEHIPAWRLRNRVGHSVWDEYTTFCFERNPWDKLVSFYFWRTKNHADPVDFETWVRTTPGLSAWSQYTIDDEVAVDVVCRYESIQDDLAAMLDRIGLDVPVVLPNDKGGHRPADDGGVLFSPELDDWVAGRFRHEIELMGYERPTRR